MSGTTDVTQQVLSFVVQTIGSTGLGESPLNALETIEVDSIADNDLARVESLDATYRWYPQSFAAPAIPNVVIPLGQLPAIPGRWILVASGIGPLPAYYQFVESLPLLPTLIPEYGPVTAVPQQGTIQFQNGDLSNSGASPGGKSIMCSSQRSVGGHGVS